MPTMYHFISVSIFILLAFAYPLTTVNAHELVDYVQLALRQSDKAYDINDLYVLREMAVNLEEHQFEYKIVPLTNIGFAKNTGSQTLGMEVTQMLDMGTEVTFGFRGDRTDLGSGYTVENSNIAKAYINVSQSLFRKWGKKYTLAPLNIAMLQSEEQKMQNERSRQELILQTATEYYNLVLAKQLIEQSDKAFIRSQEHYVAATSRQSIGLVSKVDVYRAEIAALNAENSLQNKKMAFRRSQDSLSDVLGLSEATPPEIVEPIQLVTPIVPDDWEEALLANRLDWQSHTIRSKYAALNLFRARENLKPDLVLNLGVEQRGEGESIEEAIDLDQTNWSVQLQMQSSLDLFNEQTALARENMKIRKLQRQGSSLQRKIFREAREAFEDLKAQERMYAINLQRMRQAGHALDLTQIRYERGLSDNLDVLDAENEYSSAELDISRAMIAYNITAIKLAHSLGVLDVEWLQLSLAKRKSHALLSGGKDSPPAS